VMTMTTHRFLIACFMASLATGCSQRAATPSAPAAPATSTPAPATVPTPSAAEIREDDLVGKWSGTVTTTMTQPADHATGTAASEKTGHEVVSFEIVRKGGKLFNLGRGPCCDKTPLALSRGDHGELIDKSQADSEVVAYSLAGDQLQVVTETKGRFGGTSTGLFKKAN
jgi:hypothetical protein